MSMAGPSGRPEPSEEWLRTIGQALSAFVLPQLEPLVAQMTKNLLPALELFYRSVDETASPLRARLARFAEGFATTVLTPEFLSLLEQLREQRPVNWPSPVNLNALIAVIRDDGIPLVWVPRAELVEQVTEAADREARIGILLAHENQVVADCRQVLNEITEPTLLPRVPLAQAAVEALAAGHREAAQSLATVVTESAINAAMPGSSYSKIQQKVLSDVETGPWDQWRLALALLAVYRFYTRWHPGSGEPAPHVLSRHVAVHNADVVHYTPGNAVIAIMLVSSVLRATQELLQAPEEGRS
jgi:hypothetical protein